VKDESQRDEELLERILNPARGGGDPEPLEDPRLERRQEDLEIFLADCRRVLRADSTASDLDGLTSRVLDRTTREDLSLRGDLRLVGGFVRRRLRSSVWMRLVAASLLLHLLALPVLALYAFVFEPRFTLRFERWEDYRPAPVYPEATAEPPGELEVPPLEEEPKVHEVGPEQVRER